MGEPTALEEAIMSVVNLAQAEHQRVIAHRLRAGADVCMQAGDIAGAEALTLAAGELLSELA